MPKNVKTCYTPLSMTSLMEYNKQGLIPGPDEDEETFVRRAEYCLKLRASILESMPDEIPFTVDDLSPKEIITPALEETKKQYGIAPTWVPLFFNNFELTPWQGGCTWTFFELEKSSPENSPIHTAFVQLRKTFFHQERYLGIYDRTTLLTHELAHIGRMEFEEPIFEEFLAYQSSPSKFQRWFGPIVKSAKEAYYFVISLVFIFVIDLFFLVQGDLDSYMAAMPFKLIPVALITTGCFRLWLRHRQFNRCLDQLYQLLGKKKLAREIIYRLTDAEILLFGKRSPEDILEFIREEKGKSPRWDLLCQNYFSTII